jgi:hypothetical protein
MLPEDEAEFCRFVSSDPDVQIVTGMYSGSRFDPVSVPLPPVGGPNAWCLALWNRKVISREDISNYQYDFIEFSRSVKHEDGLTPGRIWAEIESAQLDVERKDIFRKWFRRIAGYLNSWPYRFGMYRIGPATKAYFDAGGKAVEYGLGEIKAVEAIGPNERLIRRGVKRTTVQPEIERDDGSEGLTIDMEE